ncbi:TRAP transporter large permease [Saccharophagus degradans]|uniref:TRAP transporter large permease protein n=1 Tax=Saccharophagus degradans TaxID=86304 RepID=A0AAW7X803_9GAMM|nr:TRAP transporter large permease [Saccharophagus degradans]MBU2984262.1 TRAP transporter large permease [Saccharophagus degradans]MDO6422977.1 TRAP transporter large permease [Saccharophagus degradans]MDO6607122.1 TRAP transporter large permease [Saccharophagus degradans]
MDITALILLFVFGVLLAINVPIAIAIAISTLATMLVTIDSLPAVTTLAQRMSAGMDSFALLAIPFFIFSGFLMGQGGIARRLIDFAKVLVGQLPGGLAFVNVIACALFGSISGSAVAATSAIGGFMIPAMNKEGYDKNFNTAVTVTASTTGMLIPPSNILIIYSLASGGVSIAALFIAGYLPGILVAVSLMCVCGIYAKRRGYPVGQRESFATAIKKTVGAIPSLFLVVLVIGGIIGGYFTPTEAGAIAVVYSLVLSMVIYKEIKPNQIPSILTKSVTTTAIVMLLIGASAAMSWLLSYENIPQEISAGLLGITENKIILLLLINVLLLVVGTFMDMTPAVLIFTPIFLPIVETLGISPLHFGIIMILNLSIGLCTPPVGSVLFVGCSVGKTSIAQVIKPLIPLYIAMFIALALVTAFPQISEYLPKAFGLY